MKKWLSEHKKAIFWSTAATLLPMVIGCILWNDLPDSMATHWGADGVADGFGGRGAAVFVILLNKAEKGRVWKPSLILSVACTVMYQLCCD